MMMVSREAIVPVILSGGMGTRLWPMSRGDYPKQFLSFTQSGRSLIQETVLRVADRSRFAPPVLVCNHRHRFLVAEKMEEIGLRDAAILLEPSARNTAPALAAAAHYIKENHGNNAVMLVLPSDHIITRSIAFLKGVEHARSLAQQNYLVTFGITPQAPETGYGYIKLGQELTKGASFTVERFVEKPDVKTALKYISSGEYVWNSGMFCFPVGLYLSELEKFQPEMAALAEQATLARREDNYFVHLDCAAFERITGDSIDYAVMENTERAAVIPLEECGWTDAGSFKALWEMQAPDHEGNVVTGETYLMDTRDCYISCNDGVQVATLGIRDLVIISTKDCIMVADKSRAQEVKTLVNIVKDRNAPLVEQYRQVHRPWGYYDSIDAGPRYQVKRIVVKPRHSISLQMHYHRAEHWVVVSGTAVVEHNGTREVVTENQSVYIPPGTKHRLENPGRIPLELIEVQSGSYFGEDDIVRFDDTYGRVTEQD